jgi:hypothetical protein
MHTGCSTAQETKRTKKNRKHFIAGMIIVLFVCVGYAAVIQDVPPAWLSFRIDETEASKDLFTPKRGATDGMTLKCQEVEFVFGGYDFDGTVMSNVVQRFDEKGFTVVARLPTEMAQSHQALACHERLGIAYAIAGQFGPCCSQPNAHSYLLDLATFEFRRGLDLPLARHGASAAIVSNMLHVFGGNLPNRWQPTFEHWFVSLDSQTGDMVGDWKMSRVLSPLGGAHAIAFTHGQFFYFFGAVAPEQPAMHAKSLYECNLRGDRMGLGSGNVSIPTRAAFRCRANLVLQGRNCWEPIATPPEHTGAMSTVFVRDPSSNRSSILCLGGRQPTPFREAAVAPIRTVPFVQMLDLHTLQWTIFPPLPVPIKAGVAGIFGDNIVVLDLTSWRQVGVAAVPKPKAILRASLSRWREHLPDLEGCLRSVLNASISLDPADRQMRNRAFFAEKQPLFVVRVHSLDALRGVVLCAANHDVRLCARGGKHAYMGDSGCDRGVAVDLANDRDISFSGSVMSVGAGALLGQVLAAMFRQSTDPLLFLPTGHCATVGISGITLVGGHGFLARKFGLTADFLMEAVVVNKSDGAILHLDAAHTVELFRRARGGGNTGNVPFVLWSLRFQLSSVGRNARVLTLVMHVPPLYATGLLMRWQEEAPHADRNIYVEIWADKVSYFSDLIFYVKAITLLSVDDNDDLAVAQLRAFVTGLLPRGADVKVGKLKVTPLDQYVMANANTASLEQLESRVVGWDLHEYLPNAFVRNRWQGRSIGVHTSAPARFFSAMINWLNADFEIWRSEFNISSVDRCYAEFKPLGGAMRDSDGLQMSSFPHRNALWWVLINCLFRSTADRDEEGRILAAMRWMKLELVQLLTPQHQVFSYGGYEELDDPIELIREKLCDAHQCGKPLVQVPLCSDGRLHRVLCVKMPSEESCRWRVTDECTGSTPLTSIQLDREKSLPIVAIVLTGQLSRVEIESKLHRLFTPKNLAVARLVLVSALSSSQQTAFRKVHQESSKNFGTVMGDLFNGTANDLFGALVRLRIECIVYTYDRSSIQFDSLPVFSTMPFVKHSTAGRTKVGAGRSNIAQFDGLRRSMQLVLTFEEAANVHVDFVLRVRDDDFFVDDVDIGGLIRSLGDQFDLLASQCGDWGGLNDRTYFMRRESPAFEAVSVGQLSAAYDDVAPSRKNAYFVHNPEWLLLHAVISLNVQVALVPPCLFNTLTLRNLTIAQRNLTLPRCFDRAVVASSADWTDEYSRFRCNLMAPDPRLRHVDPARPCSAHPKGAIDAEAISNSGVRVCPWLAN